MRLMFALSAIAIAVAASACGTDVEGGGDGDGDGGGRRNPGTTRDEARACEVPEPRDEVCDIDPADACHLDTECESGRCTSETGESPCACAPSCSTDDDCGDGYLCECGPYLHECVEASCRSSADCGGLACRKWDRGGGCGLDVFYACETDSDACRTSDDCSPDDESCLIGEDGRPACLPITCTE